MREADLDKDLLKKAEPLSCGIAYGFRGRDGRFDIERQGRLWLAFETNDDMIYWCPTTGEIATFEGRAFAIGEDRITSASTYSFGYPLNIFGTVARWIEAKGDGIFVVDWSQAFHRLCDCPRIALDDEVRSLYFANMRPRRTPQLTDRSRRRSAA
jgi:hypothetical protein